ncbi:MAG: hypothetical protein Q7R35_17480 [Elusimicrobiota bacterium]|nr:hypothetical protein [Elusimicrobiota bacterium]
MKKHPGLSKGIVLSLLISSFVLYPSSFLHAADCSKNSDACAAGAGKLSPFAAASMVENTTAQAAPAEAKKGQAPLKPANAAPALAVSSSVPPVPAGPSSEAGGRLSSPAWLILVISGFVGLYFYLRGGIKKRRRK